MTNSNNKYSKNHIFFDMNNYNGKNLNNSRNSISKSRANLIKGH